MKCLLKISIIFISSVIFLIISRQISQAASIYFSPSNGSYLQRCESEIAVILNSEGKPVNALDLEINYDPAKIEIIDQNTEVPGIQILKGTALEAFAYNQTNNTNGTIKIALANFLADFNGTAPIAKIRFRSIGATTSAGFSIKFSGSGDTYDSNVAEAFSSLDILTSVSGATANFNAGIPGVCGSIGNAPDIIFINPVNGQVNVPENAQICFEIEDLEADIDITSVKIILNSEIYSYNNANVTYTGNSGKYMFSVTPLTPIPQNNGSYLTVFVRDLNFNQNSETISFNSLIIGTTKGTPPKVKFIYPYENATDVAVNSPIDLVISDPEADLDQSSIKILVNGVVYDLSTSGVTFTGDAAILNINIDPQSDFPKGADSFITVIAKDLQGNLLTKTIKFSTVKPTPPLIEELLKLDLSQLLKDFNNSLPPGLLKDLGFVGIISLLLLTLGSLTTLFNLIYYAKHHGLAVGMIIDKNTAFTLGGVMVELFKDNNKIAEEKTNPWGKFYLEKIQGLTPFQAIENTFQLRISYPGYQIKKVDLVIRNNMPVKVITLLRWHYSLKDLSIRFKNLIRKEFFLINLIALVMSIFAFIFVSSSINQVILIASFLLAVLSLHRKLFIGE